MKSQSITARIQKEIKKSPQKAAVLAGLFLVAIWFWAPLVGKWMPGWKSKPKRNDAEIGLVAHAAQSTSSPQSGGETNWQAKAKNMQEHPRMSSAELPEHTLDPFRKTETTDLRKPTDEVAAPEVVAPTKPDDLFVRSVIVGRSRSIARINQANYEVGDVIRSGQGEDFVVSSIEPTGVILARNGEKFDLPLKLFEASQSDHTIVLRNGSRQP
ncbi:MAG: hypothetical protein ACIALR_03575 [Blastopirellula sp. JB062]